MDAILCALLCVALTHVTGSQLHFTVTPNKAHVEDAEEVTIRCSVNLLHIKIDRVYSIMMKRRGTTVAVLLNNEVEMPDRQYIVDGTLSATPPGTAFLQLTLKNVTCADRGDYSCIMAVRKSYRNLKLGPTTAPFTVIGKPSSVVYTIEPRKEVYAVGEKVTVTCSALRRSRVSDWSWTLSHFSLSESCSYRESDCLYSCTSSVSHDVTKDYMGGKRTCGIDEKETAIKVDVTSSLITDSQSDLVLVNIESTKTVAESTTTQTSMVAPLPHGTIANVAIDYYSADKQGSDKRTLLIYCFVAVFCFLFLCVFISIFVSDRFGRPGFCRRRNYDNYSNEHRYIRRNRVVLVPVSQCSHNTPDPRYRHSESDYLIPQHETTGRTEQHQNNEVHNSRVAENASENIYEEVDHSNVQQSSSASLEAETRSCSTTSCRQYMIDMDHCNNDEPVQSYMKISLNV